MHPMADENGVRSSFLFEQRRSIWVPRNQVPIAALILGIALFQWSACLVGTVVAVAVYVLCVVENVIFQFEEEIRQDRMYNLFFYSVLAGSIAAVGAFVAKGLIYAEQTIQPISML